MGRYQFGQFELDEEARSLLRDGDPVPLTAKVFDTLAVLVRNHGRVLERDELLATIWPGAVVEEANLTQNVSTLRKALGDNSKDCRLIATVPGRGYSFVALVLEVPKPGLCNGNATDRSESVEAPPPELPGIPRRSATAWFGILLAAGILLIGLVRHQRSTSTSSERIHSLAVLPFENLSGDPDQEFFAAGMTEQLITDLSKMHALRITSRTSAMQYRHPLRKSLPEIARELGVEAIVKGSVMRSGGEVRITAQLIESKVDRYVWGESYKRDLSKALDIQREVAAAIANQIRVTVTNAERAQLAVRRPVDPEVNDLVLRGQYYADQFTQASLKKAEDYFKQAIAKDPAYAPAHAGLAYVYRSGATADMPPRQVMPKSKMEAEKALQLDETLADAHVSLAYTLIYYDWDWPEAEKHLRRAVALNPSAADAHLVYASYFQALARTAEALAEVRIAEALDPLSLPVQQMLLFSLVGSRQYDAALAQFRRTIEREPNFAAGYLIAALAYTEKGEMRQALEAVEKAEQIEPSITTKTIAAHVHAAKGNREKAEQLLKELTERRMRGYVCPYEIAHAYVKLSDNKRAFAWLEKGRQERADCMVWLLVEPWMDPLRSAPEYQELIRYIGLATGRAGPKP